MEILTLQLTQSEPLSDENLDDDEDIPVKTYIEFEAIPDDRQFKLSLLR